MNTTDQKMYIQLGKVLAAYDAFNWAASKTAPAKKALDDTKKDLSRFGYFEDCREFYERSEVREETRLSDTVYYKRALEKNFKRLRHEFFELFPGQDWVLQAYPEVFKRNESLLQIAEP